MAKAQRRRIEIDNELDADWLKHTPGYREKAAEESELLRQVVEMRIKDREDEEREVANRARRIPKPNNHPKA